MQSIETTSNESNPHSPFSIWIVVPYEIERENQILNSVEYNYYFTFECINVLPARVATDRPYETGAVHSYAWTNADNIISISVLNEWLSQVLCFCDALPHAADGAVGSLLHVASALTNKTGNG